MDEVCYDCTTSEFVAVLCIRATALFNLVLPVKTSAQHTGLCLFRVCHLGLCYCRLEKFEKAIFPFSKCIERIPSDIRYIHERAKTY